MGDQKHSRQGLPANVIPFPGNPSGPLAHPAFSKAQGLPAPEPMAVVPFLAVRVGLDGAEPPIHRTLELAGDLTLDAVHAVLQEAMGWSDSHLHAFRPPGTNERYLTAFDIEEGDEGTAEVDVRLGQLLRGVGDVLHYEYDFGDGWEHTLVVEAVRALRRTDPPARLVAGTGACPPENVGGVHVYNDVADALRGRAHAAPGVELLAWLPDGFDPDAFDLAAAQAAVADAFVTLDAPNDLPPGIRDLVEVANDQGRRALALLIASARDDRPASPEVVVAAVRPWTTLLDVLGDGVTLPQAGYLPPVVVRTLFEALDMPDWIGKGNREEHTQPVAWLRQTARDLGLVRVHRGRLLPTKKGTALHRDAARLLAHVAGTLPAGSHRAEQHAGTLTLLLVAAGRTDEFAMTDESRELLAACGWRTAQGSLDRWDVLEITRPTATVLEQVPDLPGRRLLARTALGLDLLGG